ncbi:DUF4380 domain-containing protein [Streptomyces sp. SBT349]|uniref:DUF4380 domain-containing protein n=1 Tax=Streptomyces sp. SBT349 TaxID=1580539 RepID=UPI00066C8D86|nr:DUF4380 domain-containing protein [Streptomyces sp. SBT349]
MTAGGTVTVDVVEGPAYPVVWMDNGYLRLGVVPALGGRLLSMRAGGREALWRNPALLRDDLHPVDGHVPAPVAGTMGDWRNYGGDKTWPAPQGWDSPAQWAGPPDPVLDSGPYAWTVDRSPDAASITLTSGDDPRTGLRLTRRITLPRRSGGVEMELTATNTGTRTVEWALWNITQLPGGGEVRVEVDDPAGRPVELVAGTGAPAWASREEGLVTIPPQDVVGKLGFPHASGHLRYERAGLSVTWTFDTDPGAPYPDEGARAEVWLEHPLPAPLAHLGGLNPPARIVECEVLSPLVRLAPGAEVRLPLRLEGTTSEEGGHP